jgi:hypothetical protein
MQSPAPMNPLCEMMMMVVVSEEKDYGINASYNTTS